MRRLAGLTVTAVVGIAGVISYTHIKALAGAHGYAGPDAVLVPLAVDGLVLASMLAMLDAARRGQGQHWLSRVALGLGVVATLAANVGYGVAFGWIGAIIGAWPAVAFIVSAEVLMVMIRRARAYATPPSEPKPGEPSRIAPDRTAVLRAIAERRLPDKGALPHLRDDNGRVPLP